jgi:hypothetical protein
MKNETVNAPAAGAGLPERLQEAESLLSEVLRLAVHLEKTGGAVFLTAGHENRIRKFLCLLPRPAALPAQAG